MNFYGDDRKISNRTKVFHEKLKRKSREMRKSQCFGKINIKPRLQIEMAGFFLKQNWKEKCKPHSFVG